jgi:transposase
MLLTAFPQLRHLRMHAVAVDADQVVITASAVAKASPCPLCGRPSRSIHSRRRRVVADLPIGRAAVRLCLLTRHFFCRTASCPRRIFAGRLPALVAPGARRSRGLREVLQRIALMSGGEAGARLARALGMPASPDTLLRIARVATMPVEAPPRVVGIDDWAFKRGARYGTIVCDLERHRVLALLPDRSADSTAAWLAERPTIEVVARDRSGLYADAVD